MQHQSLWHATTATPQFPTLTQDIHTPILIVGGGITGLTAAYELQRAGRPFVLIEARELGSGDTGQTTAHLSTSFDTDYHVLENLWTEETARAVADAMRSSIDFIEETSRREGIDCHFHRVPAYLYAQNENQVQQVQKEYDAARRAGLDVELTEDVPLPYPTRQAVVFPEAHFHPLKYIYGMAEHLRRNGATIYTNTHAQKLEEDNGQMVITTRDERTIRADRVIMATHLPGFLKLQQSALPPYKTYAIGYAVEGEFPHAQFYDMYEPYRYTRVAHLEDGRNILITGGFDHRVAEAKSEREHYLELQDWVRARFPVKEILFEWSGQYYITTDKIPVIGQSIQYAQVYSGSGYLGDGMTFGTVAGRMLADLVQDKPHPWADIFGPRRLNLKKAATDYVANNAEFMYHMVMDRLTWETRDVQHIQPGEGKIVQKGLKKYAVYCDESGNYTALSPVCTHMGCIVQWNDAEKTWDCPCHGGQFSCTGEPLRTPVTIALEKQPLDIQAEISSSGQS